MIGIPNIFGSLGQRYVSNGDPSAYTYEEDVLTMNGNWIDLDVSAVVPAGATRVRLYVTMLDAAFKGIQFRKNGNSNSYNVDRVTTLGDAVKATNATVEVELDSNRVLEYNVTGATTFIAIVIKGWWV